MGVIPVKSVSVTQSKTKKVNVSGECFGIKLYTDGVIIVGIRDVDIDGGKCNPAKEAGLEKDFDIRKEEAKRVLGERLLKEEENLKNSALHNIPQAVEKISELILQ